MAARFKPVEEFGFYNVECPEPRSARLWVGDRRQCESIDRCFAAGISSAESFSVGAFGREPVGVDNAALIGKLGAKSDRSIRQPAINSECEHEAIIAQREHEAVQSEREHEAIVAQWRWWQPFIFSDGRQPVFRRKRL